MKKFGVTVYLVNTGWSGGPYGIGERMDINLTRSMVSGALEGKLKNAEYEQDPIFKVWVPQTCPDVPSEILKPINTWEDKEKFKEVAMKLAAQFARKFEDSFAGKVSDSIAAECPGK
jgi:phosphoenolpyruvate carboxykinase (ATP)